MKNKKMVYTISLSSILFFFLGICIYNIYCFAYYNRHQEITYVDAINKRKYDFLYNHFDFSFSLDDFNEEITFLFDRAYLEEIYTTYYVNKGIFSSLDSFLDTYYFGHTVSSLDVEFTSRGSTHLFDRRQLFYKSISFRSANGNKTSLALYKDISFSIDDGALLWVDNKEVVCHEGICSIEKMLGGLHSLSYQVGNTTYYGLFTINKDNAFIHVSTLDSLVVATKEELVSSNFSLPIGNYVLNSCDLEDRHYCPASNKSYIRFNDDKTFSYYTYVNYSKAGDFCEGRYKIDGKFLTLSCSYHVHKVFDYDTQTGTDVISETEVQYHYKINKDFTIENNEYKWTFYN